MADNPDISTTDRYTAIGVMSGSSLDGIDLALCGFHRESGQWRFAIHEARTVPYSSEMRQRLISVMNGTALDLARLHRDLGRTIGSSCKEMLGGRRVDVIASHGHTIFHKPEEGLTTQVGCGASIASMSGMPVACDFRTTDVALGGQGAPLVPLGEQLLFPGCDAFVNLGGIANIAVHRAGGVSGYDIGPCNMALNLLAEEAGKAFDDGGVLAASGTVIPGLLNELNALPFYNEPPPRSLGREWFDTNIRASIGSSVHSLSDRMRTVVEHIAHWTAFELDRSGVSNALFTGGGAHNHFLMERIRALSRVRVDLPERSIVDYKEALIFALLGVLRLRGEVTALSSVTGASHDSIGGAVYG